MINEIIVAMRKERIHNGIKLNVYAKLFGGLSDPARLQILLCLTRSSRSAGELADDCDLSRSNASNHLACLLNCGLVRLEPQGRRNVYRLSDPRVARVLDASTALLGSEAGALIAACCNYNPFSRRALRPAAKRSRRRGAHDQRDTHQQLSPRQRVPRRGVQ